jgi:hypothetical protein
MFTVPIVAIVDWLLRIGTTGAATNARIACDRPRAEAARVDLFLRRVERRVAAPAEPRRSSA